jgi:toxin ParE1/3/4
VINRYHELARKEIIEATEHYGRVRPALGAEFLAELNAAVDMIAANPLLFEQVRPGVHPCLMDRFPDGIYYRMPFSDTVRSIVVRHHSRKPGFGMRRR